MLRCQNLQKYFLYVANLIMVKSKRMRCEEPVVCMRKNKNLYRTFLVEFEKKEATWKSQV